jgi:hypothetical protein
MPRVNSHRRRVGEHEVVKPRARRPLPTRVARAKAALRPRSLRGADAVSPIQILAASAPR